MTSPYIIGSVAGGILLALFALLMVTNDEKQARRIVKILKIAAVLATGLCVIAVALAAS